MKPRSTRLNSTNRNKFINAVLDKVLPGNQIALATQAFHDRWRDKIIDIVYGPYMEHINALPAWMLETTAVINTRIAGLRTYDGQIQFDLPHPVQIITNGPAPIPANHPLAIEYNALLQFKNDYRVKVDQLRKQLVQLVESCNTSGQLYEAWPPAEEYAACFPYEPPKRHTGAAVSDEEMDLGIKIAKINVKLP